jgi:hypothetical protein
VCLLRRSSLDDEGDNEEKSDRSDSGVVGAEEVFISGSVEVWADVGLDFAGLGRSGQESRDGGPLGALNLGKTIIKDKETGLLDTRRRGCLDLELGLRGCHAHLEFKFRLSKLAGSHNLLARSSLRDGLLGNDLLDRGGLGNGLGNNLLGNGLLGNDLLGRSSLGGDGGLGSKPTFFGRCGLGSDLLDDGLGSDLLDDGLGNDLLGDGLENDLLHGGSLLHNNLGTGGLGDDLLDRGSLLDGGWLSNSTGGQQRSIEGTGGGCEDRKQEDG